MKRPLSLNFDMPERWLSLIDLTISATPIAENISQSVYFFDMNKVAVNGEGVDLIAVPAKSIKQEVIRASVSQLCLFLNQRVHQIILNLKLKICQELRAESDQFIKIHGQN